MRESDYYSAGAYSDPSAPYNQYEPDEKEFDVTCSQTLSKTVSVSTTNYTEGVDEEWDKEEGGSYKSYWCDTSDINWADEYAENDYHTPLQLINLFKRYLEDLLNGTETTSRSPSFLKGLIADCERWTDDETEFVQD